MVEVLVTLVLLMVGLLSMAGLLVQSQRSELESYQRAQALLLLQDMVGRINANRNVASCYAFTTSSNGTPNLGTGGTMPPACAFGTATQNALVTSDLTAWNALLLGSTETTASMSNAGTLIGARGCVSYDATTEVNDSTGVPIPGSGVYTVVVAWQGHNDTFAPVTSAQPALNCGQNQYGAETKRRIVSLTIRIGAVGNTN